jgi:AcrR family transcriptional regulator
MPKAGLDRRVILEAAVRISNRVGFDKLTFKALAKSLHVQPPSLYNHFESLDDLRDALALEGVRRLTDCFVQSAAGRTGDEAVRTIAMAYRDFARFQAGLYAASQSLAWRTPRERARALRRPELMQARDQVAQVMLSVLASYRLPLEAAIHVIRVFRSAMHGFVELELSGRQDGDAPLDASFEVLIRTLIAGLLRQPWEVSSTALTQPSRGGGGRSGR